MIRSFTIYTDAVGFDNVADAAVQQLQDEGVLAPDEILSVLDVEIIGEDTYSVGVEYS